MKSLANKKDIILNHHLNAVKWVESLLEVSEELWRKPIAENKWTVAEVVGHLVFWDEFVLNNRIPYFFTDKEMPKSLDVEEVNRQAAYESRNSSKKEIIRKFMTARKQIIDEIKNFEDNLLSKEFSIGTRQLTLYEYFNGLAEHDNYHFDQIKQIMN